MLIAEGLCGAEQCRRCESNRGGNEVYPVIFGNEKTGLKLDDDEFTTGEPNLCGLASGQHSSKETSQQW